MKKRAFVRYSKNGKIVPGSLILTGGSYPQGPSTWKEVPADLCCDTGVANYFKTFDYSIDDFKASLGSEVYQCNVWIRGHIPSVNLFYDDGGASQMIGDGGKDMYDDGNALNTNYTQLYDDAKEDTYNASLNIPYTHTQAGSYQQDFLYVTPPMDGTIAPGTPFFGTGSSYFTNMYPGFFLMAASGLNGVTEFSIVGDLGSDGYGTNFYYKIPTSYEGWNAYCKTNNDQNQWDDPSVNHIVLLKGEANVIQEGDTTGEYDDHVLRGLSGITDIIFLVVSTLPSIPVITKEQFRSIADAVLDTAAGTNPCNTA